MAGKKKGKSPEYPISKAQPPSPAAWLAGAIRSRFKTDFYLDLDRKAAQTQFASNELRSFLFGHLRAGFRSTGEIPDSISHACADAYSIFK
jgi:hypothetical protein